MVKVCNFCGETIVAAKHGNRCYCDDSCYYSAKLNRNNLRYESVKTALNELRRIESILRNLYNHYGSKQYVDALLLNERSMNWTLYSSKSVIEELPVKVVGEFAYCFFQNETVRIWKL